MSFYYTPYLILPLLSGIVNGGLALYAWQRRQVPAAKWLTGLMAGISLWSFSYTLNIASSVLWQKRLFFTTGSVFFTITLFCTLPMVLEIVRVRSSLHRFVPLLAAVPLVSIILAVTSPWHQLFGFDLHLVRYDDLILLGLDQGPYLKFVHYPYVYLYYLGIVILCLTAMVYRNQQRRASLLLLIVATLLPVLVDMFELSPFKELRLTTASLSITGICYWLAVFRHHMLDLVPVAHAALFEQMQEPVLIIDQQERLAECNKTAVLRLKLPARPVGLTLNQLFPVEHPLHCLTNPSLPTSSVKDGATHWHISQSALERSGMCVGQMWVLHDITELHQAQHELRENEERFRRLADESADMVWQLDREMKFTYANPAHRTMLGYEPEKLVGLPATHILAEEDAERVRQANEVRLAAEQEGIKTGAVRYELQMLQKDGNMIWVEVHANPLRDAQGTISGYIGVTRDISIQKLAELEKAAALAYEQKARAEQEQFLTMLSHEYRTPLAIIQANLDLLELQEDRPGDTDSSKITSMKRAINRLVEVMGRSLQKSRMDYQSSAPDAELIRPVDFLDEVIDSAEGLWPHRLFMFTPDLFSVAIMGNRPQLKTALLNLLDNACKYSPEQMPVIISCSAADGVVTISVTNDGVPLSRSDITTVFEKFRRGSTSQGTAGAGLGLWLVQQIIEQHGGSVGIASTAEAGTTVSLMLPAVVSEE